MKSSTWILMVLLLVVGRPHEVAGKSFDVSCVLIFGDSTVDAGNNNYIKTVVKSNFPPYGKDFTDQIPTGRFTNGKLFSDFLAQYLGLKETVPPYLDSTLSIKDLTTGVSFASAASGWDPVTPKLNNVIPLQEQLNYYRDYKSRVETSLGKMKAKSLMEKTVFLISCGSVDYIVNYYGIGPRRLTYSISQYNQLLLNNVHHFLQDLIAEGATKIAITGLPPLGCVPVLITLYSKPAGLNRQCVYRICSAAKQYNEGLQTLLGQLQRPNLQLVYADIYTPLYDMITNPANYGFIDSYNGCCGTGLLEVGPLCNPASPVCPDDSKYVFFDSVHPTQAAYTYLFNALRPLVDAILASS